MIARITRPIAKKVSSSSSRRLSHKPRQPESNAKGQQGELERLREAVKKRDQRIAELEKQIGEQEKQIADLERQLALRKQNSTNSSKPPSSDGLAGESRRRGRAKQSRRKPGGQPGHRGAYRAWYRSKESKRFGTSCLSSASTAGIVCLLRSSRWKRAALCSGIR